MEIAELTQGQRGQGTEVGATEELAIGKHSDTARELDTPSHDGKVRVLCDSRVKSVRYATSRRVSWGYQQFVISTFIFSLQWKSEFVGFLACCLFSLTLGTALSALFVSRAGIISLRFAPLSVKLLQ